jgi:hypothetical protein
LNRIVVVRTEFFFLPIGHALRRSPRIVSCRGW